ncbi:hypothetical protein OUZ56_032461 [Daphnia magna]|uniref:Uncharacterized protein n=1 Tax=Daphnia magna TaxID=35525 RepID=A0ABR0B908_9CRUS|nr:hypothetical protein OUZ56_032461 [Daphnia magna]
MKAERTAFPGERREQRNDDSDGERRPGIPAIVELNARATSRVRINDVGTRANLECRLGFGRKIDGEKRPPERFAVQTDQAHEHRARCDEKKIAHEARGRDRELKYGKLLRESNRRCECAEYKENDQAIFVHMAGKEDYNDRAADHRYFTIQIENQREDVDRKRCVSDPDDVFFRRVEETAKIPHLCGHIPKHLVLNPVATRTAVCEEFDVHRNPERGESGDVCGQQQPDKARPVGRGDKCVRHDDEEHREGEGEENSEHRWVFAQAAPKGRAQIRGERRATAPAATLGRSFACATGI